MRADVLAPPPPPPPPPLAPLHRTTRDFLASHGIRFHERKDQSLRVVPRDLDQAAALFAKARSPPDLPPPASPRRLSCPPPPPSPVLHAQRPPRPYPSPLFAQARLRQWIMQTGLFRFTMAMSLGAPPFRDSNRSLAELAAAILLTRSGSGRGAVSLCWVVPQLKSAAAAGSGGLF